MAAQLEEGQASATPVCGSMKAAGWTLLHPETGGWHLNLGDAELGLGHLDAAIEEFHKADNTGCCHEAAPLSLAAAYAVAGKMDEANSALAEARRREPKETAKWLLEAVPSVLKEGLRKAGLAEE